MYRQSPDAISLLFTLFSWWYIIENLNLLSDLTFHNEIPTYQVQLATQAHPPGINRGDKMKPVELEGRTGEGGGQVARVAIAIAALTGQAVTINNVRGNRERGGLKSQHVTSIQFLAEITDADVEGLSVGSKTITFAPRRGPTELYQRNIKISAESGSASSLLILQAVLPFLIFAGNDSEESVELSISGGSNVSFSLSFEYLDQVLLPTLEERFGIHVERALERRGWSLGPQSRGQIRLKFQPLKIGQTLRYKPPEQRNCAESYDIKSIDVSMVGLHDEVAVGGRVDVHLQDQVVVFQALCEGYSSFPRGDAPDESPPDTLIDAMGNLDVGTGGMRKEKTHEPFGYGSLHTQTARWVASEMLPSVEFYNKGNLVKGAGISMK
ncbi:RNA 3 -terminal phosphate cyclase [Fusarium agapanthi]|uniref:RNA 3 -terminal phosphate cyclase n=1 Tax=Fusarium agapanthi TaxID=1803897 RepID=A0A9P5BB40_9HYPO|nr:RNA 3 -terminal phosphate cyclase [Fusarium agapanthi]